MHEFGQVLITVYCFHNVRANNLCGSITHILAVSENIVIKVLFYEKNTWNISHIFSDVLCSNIIMSLFRVIFSNELLLCMK